MSVAVKSGFEDYLVSVGALPAGSNGAGGRRSNGYRALMERAGFEPAAFAEIVAKFHALPRTSLEAMRAGRPTLDRFSTRFLRESAVFPYETDDGEIHLATADPSDTAILQTMELTLGRTCVREIATFDEIEMLLRDVAGTESVSITGEDEISDLANRGDDDDLDSLRDMASGAPVVRTVNELFERAVEYRATDIHIEPFRGRCKSGCGSTGCCGRCRRPRADMARAIVSRVKILAGLNIAERRLPQDGRIARRVQGNASSICASPPCRRRTAKRSSCASSTATATCSISRRSASTDATCSSAAKRSSRAAARHHPRHRADRQRQDHDALRRALDAQRRRRATSSRSRTRSSTRSHGINQIQVKPEIGLDLRSALRSFLRQDPDVIMVGEIRDQETARDRDPGLADRPPGALHAAHQRRRRRDHAPGRHGRRAVPGRARRCAASSRSASCACCAPIAAAWRRSPRRRSRATRDFAAIGFHAGELVGEAVGCDRCGNTGYRGRLGVFEILEVNERISRLIGTGTDDVSMEREARADGMTTMIEDGVAKCRSGFTSVDEILRVTASR